MNINLFPSRDLLTQQQINISAEQVVKPVTEDSSSSSIFSSMPLSSLRIEQPLQEIESKSVQLDTHSSILVEKEEFIFDVPKTPACHASTVVELENGSLLAAWFGGTKEKASDVDIWVAHQENGIWSEPLSIATGNGTPCWNPVLFKMPSDEILLFYKIGPHPTNWKGFMKRSTDEGKTWSTQESLPEGFLGPTKNKPILLPDGTLVCGSSTENVLPNECWLEITPDGGKSWKKFGPVPTDLPSKDPTEQSGMIQPTLLLAPQGHLVLLARPRHHLKQICFSISADQGHSWSSAKALNLPNPGSGIDAVTLKDGRMILIYNHAESKRHRLDLAISEDGENWQHLKTLEAEEPVNNSKFEFSYPAVIQTEDGLLHITYTWKRKLIKHLTVRLN